MDKDDAIEYLKRKGRIEGVTKYSKEEKNEINEVMKYGKIYGDPLVFLSEE